MGTDRWRLFVAIPIGYGLRADLRAAVERWRQRPDLAGLRWTDPGSWHVTLAFIGPVEMSAVPDLIGRLTDAAAVHQPMRLRAGGVGGFPSAARARVAWYGLYDPDDRLATLATDVRSAAGVDIEGEFRAHITVGRAKREQVDLRAWVREGEAPLGDVAVDRVELMRSHLGRAPAGYEVLGSIAIGAVARV